VTLFFFLILFILAERIDVMIDMYYIRVHTFFFFIYFQHHFTQLNLSHFASLIIETFLLMIISYSEKKKV
jgi:hypothetical protein